MHLFQVFDPRVNAEPELVKANSALDAYRKFCKMHKITPHKKGHLVNTKYHSDLPTPKPTPMAHDAASRRTPKGPWRDVPSTKKSKKKRVVIDRARLVEKTKNTDNYNKKRGLGKYASKRPPNKRILDTRNVG